MLPKEKRLRDAKDFKRVYSRGSFFSGKCVAINYAPNKTHLTRVGVVAGKKVSGKAVERNRVKRQAREAVHSLYGKLPKGYDVIVNIKGNAKSASAESIKKDLAGFIGKVGIK